MAQSNAVRHEALYHSKTVGVIMEKFDISKHGRGVDSFKRERRGLIQMAWNCRNRARQNPNYSNIEFVRGAQRSHLSQIKRLNELMRRHIVLVRFPQGQEFAVPKPSILMIKHVSNWQFWNGKEFGEFKSGIFYSQQSIGLPADGMWFDIVNDWQPKRHSEPIGFWSRWWKKVLDFFSRG